MSTESFSRTSNAPYDRHNYEIVLKSGKKQIFDDWDDALGYWFVHAQIPDFLDFIEIKDKKKVKTKGFGG
jgi:hypothetical protein